MHNEWPIKYSDKLIKYTYFACIRPIYLSSYVYTNKCIYGFDWLSI